MGSIPKSTNELLIEKLTEALGSETSAEKFSLHNGQVARMIIERRTHHEPVSEDQQMDDYPRAYVDLDVPVVAPCAGFAAISGADRLIGEGVVSLSYPRELDRQRAKRR